MIRAFGVSILDDAERITLSILADIIDEGMVAVSHVKIISGVSYHVKQDLSEFAQNIVYMIAEAFRPVIQSAVLIDRNDTILENEFNIIMIDGSLLHEQSNVIDAQMVASDVITITLLGNIFSPSLCATIGNGDIKIVSLEFDFDHGLIIFDMWRIVKSYRESIHNRLILSNQRQCADKP